MSPVAGAQTAIEALLALFVEVADPVTVVPTTLVVPVAAACPLSVPPLPAPLAVRLTTLEQAALSAKTSPRPDGARAPIVEPATRDAEVCAVWTCSDFALICMFASAHHEHPRTGRRSHSPDRSRRPRKNQGREALRSS